MEERDQFLGELSFTLVVAPFVLALALLGCSLALISARFLFDIAVNLGRVSVASAVRER